MLIDFDFFVGTQPTIYLKSINYIITKKVMFCKKYKKIHQEDVLDMTSLDLR